MTKKLCIIEDNPDVRSTIKLMFESLGFQVFDFEDGMAALAEIETIRPDVAIIDLGLPVMDGSEVATRIRNLDCGSKMVLACLTGRPQTSLNKCFDLNLAKPFRLKEIYAQIERCIELKQDKTRRPLAG